MCWHNTTNQNECFGRGVFSWARRHCSLRKRSFHPAAFPHMLHYCTAFPKPPVPKKCPTLWQLYQTASVSGNPPWNDLCKRFAQKWVHHEHRGLLPLVTLSWISHPATRGALDTITLRGGQSLHNLFQQEILSENLHQLSLSLIAPGTVSEVGGGGLDKDVEGLESSKNQRLDLNLIMQGKSCKRHSPWHSALPQETKDQQTLRKACITFNNENKLYTF